MADDDGDWQPYDPSPSGSSTDTAAKTQAAPAPAQTDQGDWQPYDPNTQSNDTPSTGRAAAFASGALGAIPFAKDAAALVVPPLAKGAGYVSRMLGSPDMSGAYPDDYSTAKEALNEKGAAAEHNHPGYALAGSLAGGAAVSPLMPAASVPKAIASGAGYGGLLGASQDGDLGDRARSAGWGALTGGIGGGIGGALGSVFKPAAPGTAAAQQAADSLGITLPRAVTGNPTTQAVAKGVAATPFGGKITHAIDEAVGQTGDAVSNAAGQIGAGTKENAVDVAVPAIRNWMDQGFKSDAQSIYRPLSGLNGSPVKGDMPNTRAVAQDIMNQAAGRNAANEYTPAVQDVLDAATRPGGLTFAQMNGLKTELGRSANWDARGDNEGFKRLYGALNDDVRAHAQTVGGPQGLVAFDQANTQFQGLLDRQQAIRSMLGTKSDEGVFDAFARKAQDNVGGQGRGGDLDTIAKVKQSIPESSYNELVSGMVGQLGKTQDGTFSAQKFLNDWAKMSPSAKNQVFSTQGTGQVRNNLDQVARVADFLKTAKPAGSSHLGGAVVGAEFAMRALEAVATLNPAKFAGVIAGAVGGRSAANWLASPAGSGLTAGLMRSIGAYSRAPSAATLEGVRKTMGRIGSIAGGQINLPLQASGQ
jgi:hypothetical protein